MSAADIALLAENFVILAFIAAGWHLLRQGGGLQVKTPPVPKRQPQQEQVPAVEPVATMRRTGT